MAALRDTAADWLTERRPGIVVEVTRAEGSVPRGVGTRMLVSEHVTAGTIGGGHLELKAIEHARLLLKLAPSTPTSDATGAALPEHAPLVQRYPLGPALGQCCGGVVTLGYARLDPLALARWPAPRAWFHLQLYGAGHVGRAVAQALAPLSVTVDWIDERDEEFPRFWGSGSSRESAAPWPQHIRKVCVDEVECEVQHAAPGDAYLVLTHRHDLDLKIMQKILQRGDFGFLGLIGSQTKKQRFLHRFEQLGMPASLLDRITCPIGVPGIDGKQPEVIAAAVVAQLLQIYPAPTESGAEKCRPAVDRPAVDQPLASALRAGRSSTRTV